MRLLLLNGPNLNTLGTRQPEVYGSVTLDEIVRRVTERAGARGWEVTAFQSNSEGSLIDAIQAHQGAVDAVVINPSALTHYGLSLRDALAALTVPIVEVHMSNIYAREEWRHHSVIAPVALGQIAGFGWRGYLAATDLAIEAAMERLGAARVAARGGEEA